METLRKASRSRLFLSSGNGLPLDTPDWAALTQSIPVASYVRDDLLRALDLAEACVRATCSNEDTVMVAKALTHGVFMTRHGAISAESNIQIGEEDAEIGYRIGKPYWNQGLGTEALRGMVDCCFNKRLMESLGEQ